MGFSTHLGPFLLGTIKEGAGANTGLVDVVQTATMTAPAAAVSTIILPAGAIILDIVADVTVLFNGTTPTLNVGTAATPTLYASGLALTAVGRLRPTSTAPQLVAMANVGTTDVTVRIGNAAGDSSAGTVIVKIHYAVRADNGAARPTAA